VTRVNVVSRAPARANYKPLTCGNSVSEGDCTQIPMHRDG
jgi:hypothetical protein